MLIDAAGELRGLEYSQRLFHRQRNVLAAPERPSTGATLFIGALAGGARSLGAGGGGLVRGALADIVALDADHPSLVERQGDQILDGWVFAGGREVVTAVWSQGRKVVVEGRGQGRAAILKRYRATMARLLAA